MIMFEVISPITLPSLSSRAISRRTCAKKASCTSRRSAATPGDTGVAANDRTAWSRPPSSTIGSVGVNRRTSRKPASSAACFTAAPLGQLKGAEEAGFREVRLLTPTLPMVSGKYLVAIDLGPHRDCRASDWLQDAMHLAQRSWPVGEKLQPLLTQHGVECAAWGRQWRGRRFHVFNPGCACG